MDEKQDRATHNYKITEQELVALLAIDLKGYFLLLVEEYKTRLYSFALHKTGNVQDAEDIFQTVMMNAYHALEGYPTERIRTLKLKAWLYTIAVHEIIKLIKKRSPASEPIDTSEDSFFLNLKADPHDEPEIALGLGSIEAFEELEERIDKLPEKYQEALFLRYFGGLSYQEIANELQLPLGTIRSHISRGRSLLRKLFVTKVVTEQSTGTPKSKGGRSKS